MSALGVAAEAAATRVMLVDDSAVVRGMVRKWLEVLPGVVVSHSAGNGKIAIETVAGVRPDIIILDIEMPVMDGLTALPEILRLAPKAKVLIASTLSKRNAEVTLKAMALGASDYIAKPSFNRDGNEARNNFQAELLRKVEGLSGRPMAKSSNADASDDNWAAMPAPGAVFKHRKISPVNPRVLAIGSSTGGPAALAQVIADAKADLGRVPVLITQHMPAMFTEILGKKLADVSGLSGGEAQEGEVVVPGRLYVAPGGKHMRVKKTGAVTVICLDDGPPVNHCKPAVDPLFASIADVYGASALVTVLTGMGSDGARGAVKVADAGGTVLVQDEASSVVWGMPGATAACGAAAEIIALNKIGERLGRALREGKSS